MVLYAAIFLAQILCAVHVVRTGRPIFWIFLIVFVPMLGMAVYLLAEVLPGAAGSPQAQRAASGVRRALDPGRALREAEQTLAVAPTAHNQATLAEAYLDAGRPDEAIGLYHQALSGMYATDPGMMFGLARAHFARQDFAAVQQTLDRLRDANPDFTSVEAHLLYARSLEAQGKVDEALHEYAHLAPNYPGQEARFRYAMVLRRTGREGEAQRALREICNAGKIAPRHVRRTQGEWFSLAQRALSDPTGVMQDGQHRL